jgi:hypothetical protein
VAVAFPFNVKVQLGVSSPPLEHAPDQTAVRPFETLSFTLVPVTNGADIELPDDTLIPAGLDVTFACRPVTVTVNVAV